MSIQPEDGSLPDPATYEPCPHPAGHLVPVGGGAYLCLVCKETVDPSIAVLSNRKGGVMKPSIGRIVHYVESGRCYAAIITDVNPRAVSPFPGNDLVGLTIFPGCRSLQPIPVGPSGTNGTWHWPERVPE